jgi:hypothetical protein
MRTTNQINQQTVGSYLREAVWPSNKMLPKKWSQWMEERNCLCQMILRKVAVPVGVDNRSYWESMILGITNDKFCALQANFKQELFEQFQGECVCMSSKLLNSLTPDVQHNLMLHIDNKDIGWNPISNDDGKFFVNAHGWTSRDIQENDLKYEQAEDFLRFLDKYVSRAMGTHFVSRWSKSNRTKTILDQITASDIAYTILVYKNSK